MARSESKIAFILQQLDNDIQKIDRKKHSKAKTAALTLHATLNEHARTYIQDQDKKHFYRELPYIDRKHQTRA